MLGINESRGGVINKSPWLGWDGNVYRVSIHRSIDHSQGTVNRGIVHNSYRVRKRLMRIGTTALWPIEKKVSADAEIEGK